MGDSTPSIPRRASSAWRPAPGTRHQHQRHFGAGPLHRLHQCGADAGRRRLVGGPDRRSPRRADRLDRQALDAGHAPPGGAPELALHRRRGPVPDHRAGVGRPQGRAHLGHPVRRSPRIRRAAGHRGLRLEARGVHGLQRGVRRHRRRREQDRRNPPRSLRHAALLRLQHGRLFRPLAEHGQAHRSGQAAENLLRELVPQGRARQVRLAGLRREQPGVEVDRRPARGARRMRR